MKWFADVNTSTKLFFSFGFLVLLLVFVILSTLSSLNKIATLNEEIFKKHLGAVDSVTQLDDDSSNIKAELLMMTLAGKLENEQVKKIQELYEHQEHTKNFLLEISQNDPIFQRDLDAFLALSVATKNLRDTQIIPALKSGNIEQAKITILSEYKDTTVKMSDLAEKMSEHAKTKANTAVEAARKEVTRAEYFFLGIGILAILFSTALVYLLNRLIAHPMNELSDISKQIADRNLNIQDISFSSRKDEVGVLGRSFEIMVKNLRDLTTDLSEVINHLNSSSTEIVTASNQLAASAAETATSINETTATIEEVKQTSQVASKKAKSVSEATTKTSEMSDMGKKATSDMNGVISKIHDQMNLVADTMMRLSEQTQTVGTIISTVEDLSQQTNLLAVNASIEASKAGEQGKGFSVVAQEVKSLASQSKQATNQVRNILNDIQKATSAAVMATEMGSKAVETGVGKSDEAESAILGLIQTVSDNAQAASQIAAVNHQQLVGMEQAKIAMDNIRLASEQNLESAKLLKDSMLSIQSLSIRLKSMVDQFTLKK